MKNLISKTSNLSLLLLLSLPFLAKAQEFTDVSVDEIWAGGLSVDGRVLTRVITTGDIFNAITNVDGVSCNRRDAFVISAGSSGDSNQTRVWEQQFSLLVAAQRSNTNVSVFINGCTPDERWPVAVRVTSFN